jgi:hypothetical protein
MFTHCVCTNVKNIINILNIIELSFKTTCQPREVFLYKRRPQPSIPDGKSYIKSPGGLVVSRTLGERAFLESGPIANCILARDGRGLIDFSL